MTKTIFKGNEKDCICYKPNDKHTKACDAFRFSEFIKKSAGVISELQQEQKYIEVIKSLGEYVDNLVLEKETWEDRFDKLFTNQVTEQFLTIEEIEKLETFYTKRLITTKDFIHSELAHQKQELEEGFVGELNSLGNKVEWGKADFSEELLKLISKYSK